MAHYSTSFTLITSELTCLKFEYLGQRPRQNKMSADEAYNRLTRRQRQQQQQQQHRHGQRQRQQIKAQASASDDTLASESSGHETADGITLGSHYPAIFAVISLSCCFGWITSFVG